MTRMRYLQAMSKALSDEMRRDPGIFVIGEDVQESLRGVTAGLARDFGTDRVIDAPISEQAFTGFATGAGLAGMRAVVEYQIPSLLYVSFEQIVNQAQKMRLMTGGQVRVPVTYVVPGSGARLGLAGQHSDHPYPLFIHMGVKTVLPSTAYDAYGLLVSAIRDDDPVLFFAPAAVVAKRDDVPEEPFTVELGRGRIHRSGTDLTVVAVGHLVHDVLALADALADEISIEVFDPRTLHPFDWELLAQSLSRTRRLVVYDDSNRSCGLAAEILATASEEMTLDSPPRRVTRADVPISFSVGLERRALPSTERLEAAVRDVMKDRRA
jgi:acetoin:2,6-dichlorophenolindophenol oxidoreductase subunit beta